MERGAARFRYPAEGVEREPAVIEMSLRDYLRIFSRRRWFLLGPLGVALLLVLVYCSVSEPRFRCKAELLLPGGTSSVGGPLAALVSSVAPGAGAGGYQIGTEAAVIRSWPLQEAALGLLEAYPDFLRQCSEGKIVPQTLNDVPEAIRQYMLERGLLGHPLEPASQEPVVGNPASVSQPGTAGSAGRKKTLTRENLRDMLRKMRVSPSQQGNVLQLTLVSKSPYIAADLLNAVCVAYLLNDLQSARVSSEQGLAYVTEQLGKAREELANAEQAVVEFQRQHRLADLGAYTSRLVQAISDFRNTVTTLSAEIAAQEAQDANLRRRLQGQAEKVVSSQTISNNPLVQQLQQQLANLETERANLLIEYTESSAAVRDVDARIASVREQLERAAQEIVSSRTEAPNPIRAALTTQYIQGETATIMAKARRAALERAASRVEAQMQALPPLAMELARLQRQVQIAQEKYLNLTRQYQQLQLSKESKTTPLRILAPAYVDAYLLSHPDWPKPLLLVSLAIILAGSLGLVLALAAEYLDERYPDVVSLEADLGLPVLAQVPQLKAEQSRGVNEENHVPEELQEALGALHVNLWLSHSGGGSLPILFTGPRGGEGTSWIVYNLGLLAFRAGYKTALLDCNLHRPTLHEYAGLTLSPGLYEVLVGSTTLEQGLRRQAVGDGELAILPAGESGKLGALATVWETKAFLEIMNQLSQEFELVLLDAPPALEHPDALILSRACKGIVLVTVIAKNRQLDIRQAISALGRSGAPIIGVVANRA